MKRFSIRGFAAFITAILSLTPIASQAAMNKTPITDIHRAITQEQHWLNTSRPLKAEDLQGRVILLDFWTFCCINCMHVIPELHELENEFPNDLTVVGVHSAKFANERDSENIRQAILRYDIVHPVVNDKDFRIWTSFAVQAWPTLILVNPRGQVERIYSGEGNKEAIASDIRRVLKKYGNDINRTPLPMALEKAKEPETVLKFPGKLSYAKDSAIGEAMWVSDSGHNQIVAFDVNGKELLRIGTGAAGAADGAYDKASFNAPQGVLYKDNMLYVADTENHLIRQIDLKAKKVSTIAGTGVKGYNRFISHARALKTELASPWDLAFYPDSDHLVIAMAGTHQLWTYDIKGKTLGVLAGNGRESIDDGSFPLNSLSQPSGLSVSGDKLYFVDSETSSLRVLSGKEVTTLIGTGLFNFGYAEGKRSEALMQHPLGVYADGDDIYVADSYNHSLRRYGVKDGKLHNYAGHGLRGNDEGQIVTATFNEPNDIERVGNRLFVSDTNNHRIRVIDMQANTISTLPVMPESVSHYSYSETLPNVKPLGKLALQAGKGREVQLTLPKGWKINKDAPSWLALFDTAKKQESVWGVGTGALEAKKVILPEVVNGKPYRLQGTLYYCKDEVGSLCLIQSVDQAVEVGSGGETALDIILQTPEEKK